MTILCIDYGKRKLGVAISSGILAEPLTVIKYNSQQEALSELEKIIDKFGVRQVVFGLAEGTIAVETKEFADVIMRTLQVSVEFADETLSTKDAQRMAIEAGIKRKKRKGMEDAYAAALILQSYLDK